MRLIRFSYKNYPQSRKLTEKSRRIGMLSHPIMGIALAGFLGVGSAFLFPSSVAIPGVLLLGGMIAFPVLLSVYRKKQFAKLDAEYQKLLKKKG